MTQLLLDTIPLQPLLQEGVQKLDDGKVRVTGKFQHCGVVNKNNRIYPISVWERHCKTNSDFLRMIKSRSVCGHLEHPKDGRSDLKEAAIIITDVQLRENGEVWGTLETLRTQAGRTASALFLDGVTVGISSRAHGSVKRLSNGVDEVLEDFTPETFDLVAEPSTPGAVLHESLQKSLATLGEDAIRKEESFALCQERLSALHEEIRKENWSPYWNTRIDDTVFLAEKSGRRTELLPLIDTLRSLTEMKRTKDIVAQKPTERKNMIKKYCVRKGIYEEEQITQPIEEPQVQTKVTFVTEFSVAIDVLSDDIKKKINVFRPGESLEALVILTKAELTTRNIVAKEIVGVWKDNIINLAIEVEKTAVITPDDIKNILCTLLGVYTPIAPTEISQEQIIPVQPPSEEVAEIKTERVKNFASSFGSRQYILSLQEENQKMARKISSLQKENMNLRILNNEMAKLFEEKMTQFELKALLQENPRLKEFKTMLSKCKTLPRLHETAQSLLQALKRTAPKTYSPVRKINNIKQESIRKVSAPPSAPAVFKTSENVNMMDSIQTENIFSRLAEHRSRK